MKKTLLEFLAVAAFGALGAITRYGVVLITRLITSTNFPVGTLFINVTGSFFLGWFLVFAGKGSISDTTRIGIATGFVGAYTTFSTYMYETDRMVRDGEGVRSMLYLVGSLVLGLLAVRLGFILGGGSRGGVAG